MNYMILFFIIKSYKYLASSYFNINNFIFVVLYQLDQVQVSNFNILALPQLSLIIFTFVDFQDYGTHFQL